MLATSGVAQAEWHKATSSHFVIYADQKPEKLHELAARLEKFEKAVQLLRNVKSESGDTTKVTIFVVEDLGELRSLLGRRDSGVAGIYIGRASGPVAFVPRSTGTGLKGEIKPEAVFFHEYAHHLMLQNSSYPLPQWLSEGGRPGASVGLAID